MLIRKMIGKWARSWFFKSFFWQNCMIKWNEIFHFAFNFPIMIGRKVIFVKIFERFIIFPLKSSPNPLIFKYFPFEVPNHLPCWFSLFWLLIGLTQPNPHLPMALNVSPENLSITFINFMILYRFHRTAISVCRWYALHSHYDVGAQNILQNQW